MLYPFKYGREYFMYVEWQWVQENVVIPRTSFVYKHVRQVVMKPLQISHIGVYFYLRCIGSICLTLSLLFQ